MWVGGQHHAPAALPPGERPGNHLQETEWAPRAGLVWVRKISPPPGFDPRTVQYRLKVFENKVLRKTRGPRRDNVRRKW